MGGRKKGVEGVKGVGRKAAAGKGSGASLEGAE